MADGTHFEDAAHPQRRPRLDIALVNLLDSAFQMTERQFAGLIEEAAGADLDVRLSLYTPDSLPRWDKTIGAIAGRYQGLRALKTSGADGVIVTDTIATKADLRHEPYWAELAELVSWASASTPSTMWSGRAAEAAVVKLDGPMSLRLAAPCTGVFTFERLSHDALTQGLPGLFRMPHARRRTFDSAALTASGYDVLAQSPRAGVDLFTKPGESLFVFLQGHPEYEADTLLRQYCREVGRYLRGQQPDYPQSPFAYFDAETERAFRMLALRARSAPQAQLASACAEIAEAMRPEAPWRPHAVALFRNWLETMTKAKIGISPARQLA